METGCFYSGRFYFEKKPIIKNLGLLFLLLKT